MRPSLEAVDAFVAFSSLSADIAALKEEFPLYTAAAEDVDPSYDPLLFWKQHESTFILYGMYIYTTLQNPL